jgi:hypothetical protein
MVVVATTADHGCITLGEFVESPPLVLQAGLLAGALSTGWTLFNLDRNHLHLSSGGLRNVDSRQLLHLHYQPKKGTDMTLTSTLIRRLIAMLRRCTRQPWQQDSMPSPVPAIKSAPPPLIFLERPTQRSKQRERSATPWKDASATSIPPTGPHYRRTTKSVSPRNYKMETQRNMRGR